MIIMAVPRPDVQMDSGRGNLISRKVRLNSNLGTSGCPIKKKRLEVFLLLQLMTLINSCC